MNVTTLVFLGLAVVWAIVLLPELLRKFSGRRNSDTIQSFNQQLSVLDRRDARPTSPRPAASRHDNVIDLRRPTQGRPPEGRPPEGRPTAAPRPALSSHGPARRDRVAPGTPPPPSVRKRRQEVLTVLGSAAVLTLLATVAFGGTFLLALHIVADLLLVTYLILLTQLSQSADRQAAPVAAARRRHAAVDLRTAPVARAGAPRRIAN